MHATLRVFVGFACVAVWLAASAEPAAQRDATTSTASAVLKSPDGKTIGRVELHGTPNGVLVHVTLTDAPAGVHAFHVHETGRCDPPTFESAGGHYNPTRAQHGFKDAAGPHVGDLPNVHVSTDGRAEVEAVIDDASLTGGKNNLLDADGSALVLHAGRDDYASEPAGDAGRRIGCSVITSGT